MRRNGIVLAIDGPAGAGKSTTAQLVAKALDYLYLDTGAMYRTVGLAVVRAGANADDADAVVALAKSVAIDQKAGGDGVHTFLDGEDISLMIRTPKVSDAASRVAVHQGVRDVLVATQQAIGRDGGIVLEGRDTGTAIFPDAELKVFLVADVAERAHRRKLEMAARGERADVALLERQIRERDERDRQTQLRFGPWPSEDAVLVDTTGMSIDVQVAKVVALAQVKIQAES
ncbi:MAG: (d)CMP kinase [Candidatus Latescibacteria bacterium]|jgi:cytidylate kinase|nr:(d)CMP kinase [Candidatus Latescibacterota bacterium]MBT4139722.1 (d)CMP kinase [Candidatus Latescibacterota bacterium]MBT5831715.1 (d)CMP kinase [Candidatus Latescibacterota bacterium]